MHYLRPTRLRDHLRADAMILGCSTNMKHVISFVGACLGAALFAACGGGNNGLSSSLPTSVAPQIGTRLSQSSAGLPAERMRLRPAYSVLYSFKGRPDDGASPVAGLLNVNGTLYGTTYLGGADCSSNGGCGTVFAITPSGNETVLHNFGGLGDGTGPRARLINVNGTLYSTTQYAGGSGCSGYGCGTVFSTTTSGKETVLYSFGGGSGDGANPGAGLIHVNRTLYGTTQFGGSGSCSYSGHSGCGTVFAMSTNGKERVLHSFVGGKREGKFPYAALINFNGTLYGTTYNGGGNNRGTVFKIALSGSETVLHSFKGGTEDGANPYAGLINVNGTLYGTTLQGGANCNVSAGCGTVFAITSSGKQTVLHRFAGPPGDGEEPYAGLININGTLYGTTAEGGSGTGARCMVENQLLGCGTVFAITTSGVETVLHSFKGRDGVAPIAGLLNVNGTLYGTTIRGGANNEGTIFSLSP